jgi:integrase/recombinase XerD
MKMTEGQTKSRRLETLTKCLRSCLSSRGFSDSITRSYLSDFGQYRKFLERSGLAVSWETMPEFRRYLMDSLGRPLTPKGLENKLDNVGRALEMLRVDGMLALSARVNTKLGHRLSAGPYVVHGLGHGFSVLVSVFRDHLKAIGMSETCVQHYPQYARMFLVWLEGAGVTDIRNVDERMLLAYRNGPGRFTRTGTNAQPRTRSSRETGIKKFFALLYHTRRIHADPAAHMEMTPQPRSLPRAMLDADEAERALADIDVSSPHGARDLAVLEMLYSTGLRSSELRGLRMEDVHLEERQLFVHGKGGKEALVPFGAKAAKALSLYLSFARPCLVRRNAGQDCGLLFLNACGKGMTVNVLVELVRRRTVAVGVAKHIVPHSLRHSCATHMLKNGADLRMVQQLLRHENINTTLVYTRLLISDIRDAQSKFHPRERE